MAKKFLDEIGLKRVLTNLKNNLDESFYEILGYETGVFGVNDEVWWVNTNENINQLKYHPYSIVGSYETLGDYCTITATVEKVEDWQVIYITIPFAPTEYAETTIVNVDNLSYKINTDIQEYEGDTYPVVKIGRSNNANMTRGDDSDPNSYITFTLKYKYK